MSTGDDLTTSVNAFRIQSATKHTRTGNIHKCDQRYK